MVSVADRLVALASSVPQKRARVAATWGMNAAQEERLAREIAALRLDAYTTRLSEFRIAAGLRGATTVTDRAALQAIARHAAATAAGVRQTYNKDLTAFLAAQPGGLSQADLTARARTWATERRDWKARQVAVTEAYQGRARADADFLARNDIEIQRRVVPQSSAERVCADAVARGWIRAGEEDFALPLHVGCVHGWAYRRAISRALRGRDEAWFGARTALRGADKGATLADVALHLPGRHNQRSHAGGGGGGQGGGIATGPLDLDHLETVAEIIKDADALPDQVGNKMAAAVADATGHSDKPAIADEAALDALIAAGHTEMYRGLRGEDAQAYARAFAAGDLFHATAYSYPGTHVAVGADAKNQATGYAQGGVVMRMALPKDARVVDAAKFDTEFAAHQAAMVTKIQEVVAAGKPEQVATYANLMNKSIFGMLKGYDAVRVGETSPGFHEMTILNRGIITIQGNTAALTDVALHLPGRHNQAAHGHGGGGGSGGGAPSGGGGVSAAALAALDAMPDDKPTSPAAKQWLKANQALYEQDASFRTLADATALYTQGSYGPLREATRRAAGGEPTEAHDYQLKQGHLLGKAAHPLAKDPKGFFKDQRANMNEDHTILETGAMLNAALARSRPVDGPLYRGAPLSHGHVAALRETKIGDPFDMHELTSFTTSRPLGEQFALGRATGQRRRGEVPPYTLLVEVAPGAKGLRAAALSPYAQNEVMTSGAFRVTNVQVTENQRVMESRTRNEPFGTVHITVRQEDTWDEA